MGLIMSKAKFNETLKSISQKSMLFTHPKKYKGEGTFLIRIVSVMERLHKLRKLNFRKNQVSHTKRFYCRLLKTLFFFTETEVKEGLNE